MQPCIPYKLIFLDYLCLKIFLVLVLKNMLLSQSFGQHKIFMEKQEVGWEEGSLYSLIQQVVPECLLHDTQCFGHRGYSKE